MKMYTGLVASTDLLPQEMFTFFGNAHKWSSLKESESSFHACGCHGRPPGLHAHLLPLARQPLPGAKNLCAQGVLVGAWERIPGKHFFTDFTLETLRQSSSHASLTTHSSNFLTDLRERSGFR